jgi:nucleotide-binding universal stress UspA family protein
MKRIMVGVSGTPGSQPALDWALDYAESMSLEVELVHVVDVGWRSTPLPFAESLLLEAERKLRELATKRSTSTPVTIHAAVLVGDPVHALVEHAADARLLVIGTNGTGSLRDRVFNTRAARIAGHAAVSVVVVPHRESAGTGVVVGVDGSEASAAAVAFAAREADRLGEPLRAVHSWHIPEPWAEGFIATWPGEPDDSDRLLLAESVAGLAETYPDLVVAQEVTSVRASSALYDAAFGARMLVVGSHGHRGLEKIWLGSTSEELLLGMPTVVAVIR